MVIIWAVFFAVLYVFVMLFVNLNKPKPDHIDRMYIIQDWGKQAEDFFIHHDKLRAYVDPESKRSKPFDNDQVELDLLKVLFGKTMSVRINGRWYRVLLGRVGSGSDYEYALSKRTKELIATINGRN